MHKLLLLFGCIVFFIAGCSIFPKPDTPEVSYYSIGSPAEQLVIQRSVRVKPVVSLDCNLSPMRFSTAPEKVEVDPFNRWITSPTLLVQRYLTIAFASDGTASHDTAVQLNVKLLTFDNNLTEKSATLVLLATIRDGNVIKSKRLYRATVKSDRLTAAAFATAMGEAMNEVTVALAAEINKIR